MKNLETIITTLALSLAFGFAMVQDGRTIFIEVRRTVDLPGNISLDRIDATKAERTVLDSFVNILLSSIFLYQLINKGFHFISD